MKTEEALNKIVSSVEEALSINNGWYGVSVCSYLLQEYPHLLPIRKLLRRCQTTTIPVPLTPISKLSLKIKSWIILGPKLLKCIVYLKCKKFNKLLSYSETLLNENPYFLPIYFIQLKMSKMIGDIELQIFICECILRIKSLIKIELLLSRYYLQTKQFDLAESLALLALKKEPNLIEADNLHKKIMVERLKENMRNTPLRAPTAHEK